MELNNELESFVLSLRLLKSWKQKVRRLEEEKKDKLIVIECKMSGLSHSGEILSKEQMKSSKPMPTSSNHGQGINYESLIQKKDEIEEEYREKESHYQYLINNVVNVLDAMDERDRKMTVELHVKRRFTSESLAYKYGYASSWGIKKHINKAIVKALRVVNATEK